MLPGIIAAKPWFCVESVFDIQYWHWRNHHLLSLTHTLFFRSVLMRSEESSFLYRELLQLSDLMFSVEEQQLWWTVVRVFLITMNISWGGTKPWTAVSDNKADETGKSSLEWWSQCSSLLIITADTCEKWQCDMMVSWHSLTDLAALISTHQYQCR